MKQRDDLLTELEQFARSKPAATVLMQRISDRLHEEVVRYNWVGFYLITRTIRDRWCWGRTRARKPSMSTFR